MGGWGSTRWDKHQVAHTLEHSRALSMRYALLDTAGLEALGLLDWARQFMGDIHHTVRYAEDGTPIAAEVRFRVHPAFGLWDTCVLEIVTVQTAAGMRQRLWRCPQERDGEECGRLVRTLYLPDGGAGFGCRHCHKLVYWRNQIHDKNSARRGVLAHAHVQRGLARSQRAMDRLDRWRR